MRFTINCLCCLPQECVSVVWCDCLLLNYWGYLMYLMFSASLVLVILLHPCGCPCWFGTCQSTPVSRALALYSTALTVSLHMSA